MRKIINLLAVFVVVTLLIGGLAYATRSAQAAVWMQKVDPWVMETAVSQPQTEFLIYLTEQADLSEAANLTSKLEKGTYVYEQLTAVAQRTQPAIIASLKAQGVAYRPFWIANMIWVRGNANMVQTMAQRSDVAHIYANPAVALSEPEEVNVDNLIQAALSVEWNIALVNAPDVWDAGYTGQGIVIGGQDTGYDWNHPALINQYRGGNGVTASHDYNWHDAIHSNSGPNSCGFDSPEPCDDYGHGTHTMGTMVGDDGGSNQIGMAPGAQWIGCRNMDNGWGTPATYSECYQWFIAPTDLNDQNPDPAKAPHVINNSWACPPSEGCTDPNVLLTAVQNVRAAGIVTVHSAGNEGPSCSTVGNPAAIYGESFSVGATSSSDAIASFSSRGPVTVDGSSRRKPDISAPGTNIRSSVPGTGYGVKQGTSMAAPHVAGLVALLLSAQPALVGDVDGIESVIEQTAVPLTTRQACGGDGPADVPNHVFGYGRIDATRHNLQIRNSTPVAIAQPGDRISYTLAITHSHLFTQTNNVILTNTIPSGTVLVTATVPYTFNGTTVQWQLPSLAANDHWQVALMVQVLTTTTSSIIENVAYGVRSDEVTAVTGPPVTTTLRPPFIYYFPVFLKE